MANANAPRGLSPIQNGDGTPWNQQANMYYIPAADGSQYNIGDAVKSAAGGDANGVPQIAKAVAGDTLRGVIVGFRVTNPDTLAGTALPLETLNVPATKTKDYYALVVDDPSVIFEIQDDGAAALTAAACNKNANIVVTNPTFGPNSASTLNSSTVAVTSTFVLKIIGLVQRPDNAFGAYAKWRVKINQHELMGNTAGL